MTQQHLPKVFGRTLTHAEFLKESPISLMPEKILQPLKPQELRDPF
jgi:hypothetical protein